MWRLLGALSVLGRVSGRATSPSDGKRNTARRARTDLQPGATSWRPAHALSLRSWAGSESRAAKGPVRASGATRRGCGPLSGGSSAQGPEVRGGGTIPPPVNVPALPPRLRAALAGRTAHRGCRSAASAVADWPWPVGRRPTANGRDGEGSTAYLSKSGQISRFARASGSPSCQSPLVRCLAITAASGWLATDASTKRSTGK